MRILINSSLVIQAYVLTRIAGLKKVFNKIVCFTVFSMSSIFSISSIAQAAEVPVLEYFPQCNYQILDKRAYKYKVEKTNDSNVLTQENLSKAMQILIGRMRSHAEELNADAILLVDREIEGVEEKTWTKNQDEHVLVTYMAEIIKQCDNNSDTSRKPTPYDKFGAPQKEITLGKVGGWQQQIVFAMPSDQKRLEPELNSTEISIENGIYGVPLSTPFGEVIKIFGTPTLSMRINDKQQLIAYGRNHWFWFTNSKLARVATDSGIFTTEFINLLAFDDRFEQQEWQIEGKIRKGDKIPPELASNSANNQTLNILSENYVDEDNQRTISKVIGFDIVQREFNALPQVELIDSQVFNNVIDTYIGSENRLQLLVSDLPQQPIAKIWRDSTTELLLFDNHIVVEATGNNVSKVYYLDKVLASQQSNGWQFNGIEQGQTLQHVMSFLGDDAFEFDGVVEFSGDKFQAELFFEKVNSEMRLYGAEVAIY